MAGPPLILPPGGPGAANPLARLGRFLDRNINDVCKRLPGVKPMNCYSPAVTGIPNSSGHDLLLTPNLPGSARGVSQLMAERLLSVLASQSLGDTARVNAVLNPMTLRAFRALGDIQQLQFIDRLWNAVCSSHQFNTAAENMFDPAYDAPTGNQSLPTTWSPAGRSTSVYRKRLSGQPWRDLCIGFRVDGRDQSSINRILAQGMTQQRANAAFMLNTRGLQLAGTVVNDTNLARIWTANHDIFNETAVCVSRNLFGGTAFPERTTGDRNVDNPSGKAVRCYLWAVNCKGLLGFDTEGYQNGLPNSRQWRPGEKAFPEIAQDRVIGYVAIDRLGAPAGGGWRFAIPPASAWTLTGAVTIKQRVYLNDELSAWIGDHTIRPEYDFAT